MRTSSALLALALFCAGEAPAQQRLAMWVTIAPPSGSYLDYEVIFPAPAGPPQWRNLATGALAPVTLPPGAPPGAPIGTDVTHLQGPESARYGFSPFNPPPPLPPGATWQRTGYLYDRATGAPAYRRVARYHKVVTLPGP